jgi:hypothetical protein
MSSHRGPSSKGRRPRGDARTGTSQTQPRARDADGVIMLYADGADPSPRPVPKDSMSEDVALAQLRAERDAALEVVAYLKQQLCCVCAYHAHLLEEERRRMFQERMELAGQLALLHEELYRRTHPDAITARTVRRPLRRASDEDGTGAR